MMPNFIIELDMENSAFTSNQGNEISRILKEVAYQVETTEVLSDQSSNLYDANGNRVGFYVVLGNDEEVGND